MLQVKPENRPTCDQIIQMPTFIKKAKYFFPSLVQNYQILDQSILLKTINVPKSMMHSEETQFWNDLTHRLPKPNYDRLSTNNHDTSFHHMNTSTIIEDAYDIYTNRS
jgi:hypothetical protein